MTLRISNGWQHVGRRTIPPQIRSKLQPFCSGTPFETALPWFGLVWSGLSTLQMQSYRYGYVQGFREIYFCFAFTFGTFNFFLYYYLYLICISPSTSSLRILAVAVAVAIRYRRVPLFARCPDNRWQICCLPSQLSAALPGMGRAQLRTTLDDHGMSSVHLVHCIDLTLAS